MTGRLVPLTVDGLIYASSMVMLDSARRKVPVPALARWLLGVGIARRSRPTWRTVLVTGRLVLWWLRGLRSPLVGSYELLMVIIRSTQVPAG